MVTGHTHTNTHARARARTSDSYKRIPFFLGNKAGQRNGHQLNSTCDTQNAARHGVIDT